MSIQFPRGNTAANDAYTGPQGAISVDEEGDNVRVHDGITAGGAFQIGVSTATATNLSVNYATSSFTVTSSTGTDATIGAATPTQAGALSSTDKSKLDGIEAGADVNVATDLNSTYAASTVTVTSSTGNNTTLAAVTTTTAGVMTSTDKTKLNGIQAGAEANTVDSVAGKTGAVTLAKSDVGLGNVENYGIATTIEAQAATSNSKYLTPLRAKELLAAGNFNIDFGAL